MRGENCEYMFPLDVLSVPGGLPEVFVLLRLLVVVF